MCRLYGLHATHPTRAACELIDAQNALIRQSVEDARGLSNPDGWGLGRIHDGTAACFRQVGPASEDASYRTEALRMQGELLLAHVRRATVGTPTRANTHPFRSGHAMLIHNGHLPAFDAVRPALLDALPPGHRSAIQGTTDSEHVFALLLHEREQHPDAPLHVVTRRVAQQVQAWCDAVPETNAPRPHPELDVDLHAVGLNLLWTDGTTLAASRLHRSLYVLERTEPRVCPICNSAHATPADDRPYRAVVVASEPITNEDWQPVPNGSVLSVSPRAERTIEPLAPSS